MLPMFLCCAANNLQTSKSLQGAANLPPISQSSPGGRGTRSASPARAAGGPQRPGTTPGSGPLRKQAEEEE